MLMQRWKVRSSWRVVPTRTAVAGCISGCRAGVALQGLTLRREPREGFTQSWPCKTGQGQDRHPQG